MFNEEKYINKLEQTKIEAPYQLSICEILAIANRYGKNDSFNLISAAYNAGFVRGQNNIRNAQKRKEAKAG